MFVSKLQDASMQLVLTERIHHGTRCKLQTDGLQKKKEKKGGKKGCSLLSSRKQRASEVFWCLSEVHLFTAELWANVAQAATSPLTKRESQGAVDLQWGKTTRQKKRLYFQGVMEWLWEKKKRAREEAKGGFSTKLRNWSLLRQC